VIDRVWNELKGYPSRWLLLLVLLFLFFPQIDIGFSGLFYDAATGWTGGNGIEFIRRVVPTLIIGTFVFCVVLWVAGIWYEQWFWGITTPRAIYLMVTLIVGPGLLVETVLKPNWGRARPKDVTVFAGDQPFTPPLWIADNCDRNCSFVSGHAAIGYWVTAYAFLAPAAWRKPAMAAAFLFGSLMGLARIMQGAHFLSDVIFAAIIVMGVNAIVFQLMFEKKWMNRFVGEE
jgi:lipid A 4'-phosphatase